MLKRIGACVIVIAAGVMSGPASAGYFGVAINQNTLQDWDDVGAALDDGSFTSQKSEDTDNGFRIFGGFGQNPNFVVEIGYSDFGEATFDAQSDGCCFYPAGPVSADAAMSGIDVSLVGRIPVSDSFDVTARLGMLKWDFEVDARVSGGSGSDSDDGTDVLFGAGLQFALSDSVSLRGEFTRYDIADTDLDSLSLSLVFSGGN
jgi:OmpA-OmpF porin, OOP family